MPLKICCPKGHKFLLKDDMAGRRIGCPTCRSVIDVPTPQEVHVAEEVATAQVMVEETEREEAEAQPKVAKKKKKFKSSMTKKVKRQSRRVGLKVVGIGLVFLAVAMILFLSGLVCSTIGLAVPTWSLLGAGSLQLSALLEIAAMLLFFWVPREAGARGALIGTVFVTLASFAVQTSIWFLPHFVSEEALPWVIAGIFGLIVMLWMIHKVMLFTFTGRVADYVGASGTEHDSQRLIFQAIMLPILTAGYPFLAAFLLISGSVLAILILLACSLGLIGYWILYAIRYIALMFMLREFVSE